MIVNNGVLIGQFDNPGAITALIPHAKHIRYQGKELVLVPHHLDETQILKNLGIDAPSPILTQHRFTGRFTPMPHQLETAAFGTLHKRGFILNEMRTGKTASALWGADYLKSIGAIDEVIVICPLSVIDVWIREAFGTLPHRSAYAMIGTRDKRLKALESKDVFIKVINFDGLVSIQKEVKAYTANKRILIIVDECATYRTYGTKRYKALKEIITPNTWLWMMTGTPTPNAPTDAWAQAKLVNPKNVPNSFKLFQESVMKQIGPYKWVPKPGSEKTAFNALQPAIRFLRKDVMKTMPTITEDRPCEMTPEQKVAYDNFKKRMRHEDKEAGVDITAANAAVRILKLQQVFCGVVKDDDGAPVFLQNNPRLDLTEELVEETGGKAIIFVPFKFSMEQLRVHLGKRWRTAVVNGDTPKAKRDAIFQGFQNLNEIDVIVAHPATTSHGLDLSASSTIIWYAPTYSNEYYQQANARIEGPNQTENCGIYHIGCHPLEWAIYEVTRKKGSMQDALLSLYTQLLDGGPLV